MDEQHPEVSSVSPTETTERKRDPSLNVAALKLIALAITTIGNLAAVLTSLADKAQPPTFWLWGATLVGAIAIVAPNKSTRLQGSLGRWAVPAAVAMLVFGMWTFAYRDHIAYAASMPWSKARDRVVVSSDLAWRILETQSGASRETLVGLIDKLIATTAASSYVSGVAVASDDKIRSAEVGQFALSLTGASQGKDISLRIASLSQPPSSESRVECEFQASNCFLGQRFFLRSPYPSTVVTGLVRSTDRAMIRFLVQHSFAVFMISRGARSAAEQLLQSNVEEFERFMTPSEKSTIVPILKDAAHYLAKSTDATKVGYAGVALTLAKRLDPEDPELDVLLDFLLSTSRSVSQTKAELDSGSLTNGAKPELAHSGLAHSLLGERAYQSCDLSRAVHEYNAALADGALSPDRKYLLHRALAFALTQISASNADDILEHLRAALAIDDSDATLHALAGYAWASRENPTMADAEFAAANRTPQARTAVAYWQARRLAENSPPDLTLKATYNAKALADLKTAADDPTLTSPLLMATLARSLRQTNGCDAGVLHYVDSALRQSPELGIANRMKGLCLLSNQTELGSAGRTANLAAAMPFLKTADARCAGDVETYDALAKAYRALGDPKEAEAARHKGLEMACQLEPGALECTLIEISKALDAKSRAPACALVDQRYEESHDESHLYFLVSAGLDFYRHGDLADAAVVFQRVIRDSAPSILQSDAQCDLGFVLLDQHRLNEAIEVFQQGLARDTATMHNADCRAGLAVAWYAVDARDDAKRDYRSAVEWDATYKNPDVMRTVNVWSDYAIGLARNVIILLQP